MTEFRELYFVRRFEDEIAAADVASDKAKVIHLELALRYAIRARVENDVANIDQRAPIHQTIHAH
jgi:hypothetical protein